MIVTIKLYFKHHKHKHDKKIRKLTNVHDRKKYFRQKLRFCHQISEKRKPGNFSIVTLLETITT